MSSAHAGFLVAWLRFLLVALSLHLGAVGMSALVIEDDSCEETECCSDCPIERSGEECPSGCPNCHCHHGGGAVAIPEVKGEQVALPARDQNVEKARPSEATAPRQPFVGSLFRPPRALVSIT